MRKLQCQIMWPKIINIIKEERNEKKAGRLDFNTSDKLVYCSEINSSTYSMIIKEC